MTAELKFWSLVQRGPNASCWPWSGTKCNNGYGRFMFAYRLYLAHAFSAELAHGPRPKGAFVLHSCDNPSCVNPAHLRYGSPAENVKDMVDRCRQVRGERQHNARLRESDIPVILADQRTNGEIGKDYGVHHAVIARVKMRKTWKHVVFNGVIYRNPTGKPGQRSIPHRAVA